jgi:hypothetical protein
VSPSRTNEPALRHVSGTLVRSVPVVVTPPPDREYQMRVRRMFRVYAPTKHDEDIKEMLYVWQGREAALLEALCTVYGPEPLDASAGASSPTGRGYLHHPVGTQLTSADLLADRLADCARRPVREAAPPVLRCAAIVRDEEAHPPVVASPRLLYDDRFGYLSNEHPARTPELSRAMISVAEKEFANYAFAPVSVTATSGDPSMAVRPVLVGQQVAVDHELSALERIHRRRQLYGLRTPEYPPAERGDHNANRPHHSSPPRQPLSASPSPSRQRRVVTV